MVNGLVVLRIGRIEEAAIAFERASEYKQDLPETWYNLEAALWLAAKAPETRRAFKRAYRLRKILSDKGAGFFKA